MCEQYLKHEPTDGAVWAWYGHTLVHLGRYSEAGAALQTARGLVTRDDVRGFVLGCQGDLEETQGHYREQRNFTVKPSTVKAWESFFESGES
jgi:hypothetical protein